MLGVDLFLLRTPFEDLFVRVKPASTSLTPGERDLASRALFDLRFALESGEPDAFELAQRLIAAVDGSSLLGSVVLAPSPSTPVLAGALLQRLEEELFKGRLLVERETIQQLTNQREEFFPELPPLPKPEAVAGSSSFELRLVDGIGQAINGVDAEFVADGSATVATNAAGVALLDGVQASTASVSVVDVAALEKVLDPRWQKLRPGKPPKEANLQEVVFQGGELGPFGLKAEVPNTVVVKPPLGRLFVELFDKTGRVRHADRKFAISGPMAFQGTTDQDGRLVQEAVFPGDYELTLTLEHFKDDPDQAVDVLTTPLVVLGPTDSGPLVRMIGAVPRSILARLHMFFNTNKAFLLPTALPSIQKLRKLYFDNTPCDLLVVGHADTRGGTAYNDKLSLERAEATIAYLTDDHDAWLKFYGAGIEQKKRWGKVEDHLMIMSMPDFVTKPKGENEVEWFQRTRLLEVDGVAGEETRTALVKEYMTLDGASLEEFGIEIKTTAHGCGENFPLDDSGEELDEAPPDEKRDPIDRRVELFFFDPEFGISPKPASQNSKPGSPEYPKWRERVAETIELRADELDGPKVTFVELADAHFRTDSAVVLPEGEDPDQTGEHQALTSIGLIAGVLRFNDERPDLTLLVAGHTDTSASEKHNQELSELRARVALALLKGERDDFRNTCNSRNRVADIKQILSWISRAFADLGFDCDPGKINDIPDDKPVRKFQNVFNANKSALGSTADDLEPDGAVGALTWGAFFDCYEFALREELGEDAQGLAALRSKLEFADPERESLGFGEHFPIEELGVDDFRSQTNRRVEVLFFEPNEEPDLQQAQSDPETSEIYLPGHYHRSPISFEGTSAKVRDLRLRVLDGERNPLPEANVQVTQGSLRRDLTADAEGFVQLRVRREPTTVRVQWGAPGDGDDFPFQLEFFPAPPDGELGAFQRLHNVGYSTEPTLEKKVLAFQEDFGRDKTGQFQDIEQELIAWHDGGNKPVVNV